VKVVPASDSAALLSATARKAQLDRSRRDRATEHLARLNPEFKLNLALTTDSATARTTKENSIRLRMMLVYFSL